MGMASMKIKTDVKCDIKELARKIGQDVGQLWINGRPSSAVSKAFSERLKHDLAKMAKLMNARLSVEHSTFCTPSVRFEILREAIWHRTSTDHTNDLIKGVCNEITKVARSVYGEVFPSVRHLAEDDQFPVTALDAMSRRFQILKRERRQASLDTCERTNAVLRHVSQKVIQQQTDQFFANLASADIGDALVIAARDAHDRWSDKNGLKMPPPAVLEDASYVAGKALELQTSLKPEDGERMRAIQEEYKNLIEDRNEKQQAPTALSM